MNLNFTSKSDLDAQPAPTHIILASQSIGRKQLLEKLAIRFRTAVSNIDEESINYNDPVKTIKARAKAKLNEIVNNQKVYHLDDKAKNLIIAADSMAIVGKKTYGKPADREEAKVILRKLMDRTHTFFTACSIALIDEEGKVKKRWNKTAETKVSMRKMSNAELESYVTRYDFIRFAGAYALNEAPWDLVTKVDGSYTNVIGLPFEVLLPILRSLEIIV
ncbi:Maf family nucleotide pyrophosphatase [Patescibacteria group bacterium]